MINKVFRFLRFLLAESGRPVLSIRADVRSVEKAKAGGESEREVIETPSEVRRAA